MERHLQTLVVAPLILCFAGMDEDDDDDDDDKGAGRK
jgi:hypothetical protein